MKYVKKYVPVIIAFIAFVCLSILWKTTSDETARDMYLMTDTREYHNLLKWQLEEEQTVVQTFMSEETIYALDLFLDRFDEKQDVRVTVYNETDDIVIGDGVAAVAGGHTRIILEDVKYFGTEKQYSISIRKAPGDEKPLGIFITEDNLYTWGNMFINDVEQSCDIAFRIYGEQQQKTGYWKIYLIYAGLLMLAVLAVWYSKWPFERQALILILTAGLIYVFLFTPQTIHDEDVHIDNAYRITNMMLGKGYSDEEGGMLIREEDLKVYQLTGRNSLQNHEYVMKNNSLFAKEQQSVTVRGRELSSNPLLYFPTVIGMCLGRILGLGCFPMFYLGKIFGVLFFSICIYYAIKITPIGKSVFAVTALLPMTLQQTAGITYDSPLNAVALLTLALCLKLVYGKEKFSKWNWCALLCFGMWLILFKRGVYCFILIFVFFYFLKEKKKLNKKVIWTVAVLFSLVIFMNRGIVASLFHSLASAETVSGEKYSFLFMIKEPLEFLKLLWSTFYTQGSIYIETMIGSRLAWTEIVINNLLIVSFGILLVIAMLRKEEEERLIGKRDKVVFALICSGVTGAIVLAALGWTDVGMDYIWGIQGRYFLPILPVILLLFDSANLTFKKRNDKHILVAAGILQIFVVFDISRFILMH